jgi:hypothetical protein
MSALIVEEVNAPKPLQQLLSLALARQWNLPEALVIKVSQSQLLLQLKCFETGLLEQLLSKIYSVICLLGWRSH